jgi:hypothetical protein
MHNAFLLVVVTDFVCQICIAYISLSMGSQKALKEFKCTIATTRLGIEAQYSRETATEDLSVSITTVNSGEESYNAEYEAMLHRDSRLMSLYTDDIVK